MKPALISLFALSLVATAFSDTVTLSVKGMATSGYQTGYSEQAIELRAGDTAEILTAYTTSNSYTPLAIQIDGVEARPRSILTSFSGSAQSVINRWVIAGPATIRAAIDNAPGSYYEGAMSFITASIKRFDSGPSSEPSGTVVIPEDANGSFKVILESSTDLITWTAANPGTYGGNTQRRFFRTRIVKE